MKRIYEHQRLYLWLVLLIMLTGCIYFILKCGYKKPRVAASRNSTNLQSIPTYTIYSTIKSA